MYVPFIPDVKGETIIDNLLDYNKKQGSVISNEIIKHLKEYEFDHHSRALAKYLPTFIEYELPNLPDYLESRLMSTLESEEL